MDDKVGAYTTLHSCVDKEKKNVGSATFGYTKKLSLIFEKLLNDVTECFLHGYPQLKNDVTNGWFVRGLLLLGWLLPILVLLPYYFIDSNLDDCWEKFGQSSLFLSVPVLIIIILNISFLVNVVKMIRAKVRAENPGISVFP